MTEGSERRLLSLAAFASIDLSLPQGHALHVRGLLDAMADRGDRVVLLTPRPASPAPAVRFRKVEVPILRWRVLGLWSFEILGGLLLLLHCLRDRPGVIYARQDLYTFAPAAVAWILRIPLVSEVNASIVDEVEIWGRASVKRIAQVCERFSLSRAAAILVMTAPLRDTLARRVGIDRSRIHVVPIGTHIPSGFDPKETRERLRVPPDAFLVGFAGNLSPVQGVETSIDAFGHLAEKGIHLWIIGTGTTETRLHEQAARFGGRVRFFGGVPREESDRLIAACQILVAPYRKPEYERIYGDWGQTSKIVTYLAADRPILVSDIPSYRWVEELQVGGLFSAGDAAALAELIDRWASRWRVEGSPLVGWPWEFPGPGRRFVESGHTWAHVAARTAGIIAALPISSTRRGRSRAR